MAPKSALVITSISAPNLALAAFAAGCRWKHHDFVVVGDLASPPGFALDGCDFWGIERQQDFPSRLARLLPVKHYSRKNLGYQIAIHKGVEVIVETDDDNFPYESFWAERSESQRVPLVGDAGWVNTYRFFTSALIWPRGFPLEHVQSSQAVIRGSEQTICCPIQQGLANKNPDVDAVYRLLMPLPQSFSNGPSVALGKGCWAPFNSQNTTWFKAAFPLLYLPSYCSFRTCDIWRSFVAFRICWANEWPILFHEATVYQERNEHNLLQDFKDEIEGYTNNARICAELARLDIGPGTEKIGDNLRKCYELLILLGLVQKEEMQLLDAWLLDLVSLG